MGVGIIGGADGPTAIFISGGPFGFILMLLAGAAAITAAVWFIRRSRKQ